MTILEDIQDTIKSLNQHPSLTRYIHPQYINGTLYLTEEQWGRFIAEYVDTPVDERTTIESIWYNPDNHAGGINSIPVTILTPGQSITLDGGALLVCTAWGEPYTIHPTHQALYVTPNNYSACGLQLEKDPDEPAYNSDPPNTY